MAKRYLVVEGHPTQPKLVLNLPTGEMLLEPSLTEVQAALSKLSPRDWQENDCGLLTPEYDLLMLFAPEHGYVLVIQSDKHPHGNLIARQEQPSDEVLEVEAGNQYLIFENHCVPFETLWEAVEHYLTLQQLKPTLLWTQESPFAPL